MQNTILTIQVIISILLIVSILLQNRSEGMGVLGVGGSGGSHHTKRGFEQFLHQASITLSVAFLGISIISVSLGA